MESCQPIKRLRDKKKKKKKKKKEEEEEEEEAFLSQTEILRVSAQQVIR